MSEKCDRCGSVGEDRRTLKMACFYDMSELDLPFVEINHYGEILTQTGTRVLPNLRIKVPEWSAPTGKDVRDNPMYTLRVCKRCRSEWMQSIKEWFHRTPCGRDGDADERQPSEVGSGIFVRDLGVNKEITEEWDRRNPGCEPVVAKTGE